MTNHRCPPHYWILSEPDGQLCHAICKDCGAKGDFASSPRKTKASKKPRIAGRETKTNESPKL